MNRGHNNLAGNPASTNRPRYLALGVMGLVYAGLSWLWLTWGIDAHKPCVDNFEGGCSMGKYFLALLSFLPAAVCAALAAVMIPILATIAVLAGRSQLVGGILVAIPSLYMLYMVYALFLP